MWKKKEERPNIRETDVKKIMQKKQKRKIVRES